MAVAHDTGSFDWPYTSAARVWSQGAADGRDGGGDDDLQIRRVPFRFDESTPYQWLPANPDFGHLLNGIAVIAVAFETYIVSVVREAFDLITDAGVAEEADAFLRQQAQHARAHRLHLRALAVQHPGVKAVVDDAVAGYDALLDAEPLEFHLAYIADLEATFTPLFTMKAEQSGRPLRAG